MADPVADDPSTSAVGNILKGLPISDLVAAPLMAACESQIRLAQSMANFIRTVGFMPVKNSTDRLKAVELDFSMTRPNRLANGDIVEEKLDLAVPILAIVPIPNLQVDNVTVDFEISIETQVVESDSFDQTYDQNVDQKARCGGPSIKSHGTLSAHHDQTRRTDISAKYSFHIEAKQMPPPEGLMKVLDILSTACAPRQVTQTQGRQRITAR